MGSYQKKKSESIDKYSYFAHSSTLFVSNLPYTATSVDLQTLFSDIAPVRSAFVVTEPGTGISKGVGYVSFALKEDAASAFASLEKDGIELVGRKLRVQWAENKARRLYFVFQRTVIDDKFSPKKDETRMPSKKNQNLVHLLGHCNLDFHMTHLRLGPLSSLAFPLE